MLHAVVLVVQQSGTISRVIVRENILITAHKQRFLIIAVYCLAINARMRRSVRCKRKERSVWRPDRRPVVCRIGSEPSQLASNEVLQPDIPVSALGIRNHGSQQLAIR